MDLVTTYANKLQAYGFVPANHETPNFFPVEKLPVYDQSGDTIEGVCRLVRTDTNKTLKVHSDQYRLITYNESFEAFDNALNASGLDLTDMQVATDMTHDGGRCFRQYVLPAHQIDMGDGDVLALRIIMFNSYDGTTTFRGMAGAYRFVCANQCVIGRHLIKVSIKHRGSAQIEPSIDTIVETAAHFADLEPRLLNWKSRSVREKDAYEAIVTMGVAEQHSDAVFRDWRLNQDPTLYGIWNAMTSWSTHGPRAESKNRAQNVSDREMQVAGAIESGVWQELESA